MESRKRRRGRPAGRSLEALKVVKLNRSIWNGARYRVWPLRQIHNAWKFLKGRSCFKTTLTSQHICCHGRLRDSRGELQIFFLVFLEGNLNSCAIRFYNLPYTVLSCPSSCRSHKLRYEIKQNRS